MSDKEIDEILEEIKRHAMQESGEEEAPKEEVEDSVPKSNAMADIFKLINEKDETEEAEEVPAEEEAPDEVIPDEAPEEIEAPVEAPEEIAEEAAEEAEISLSDDAEEEEESAPEEEIDFSLPEEEVAEQEPEEEVMFVIPVDEPEELIAQEDEEPELQEEPAEAPAAPEEEEEPIALEDIDLNNFSSDRPEDDEEPENKKSRKPLIIALAIILIIAIGAAVYFGFFHNKGDDFATTATKDAASESTTVSTVLGPTNPLTGETGYNQAAIGKRPVAVVVENEYSTESVRPQWGINKADIVLEGESEYSTRLLLFWADFTNMPSQIGSTRSARPPFIRFSQLFDSVFIHAGLSKSKGNYIGANTVFETDNVDHINLLNYSEDGTYFGRDKSRTSTIEHTGYLNGTNTPQLLEKVGFRTDVNTAKFSTLEFNETAQKLSDTAATSAKFIWSDVHSSGHCPKVGKFYYDASLEKYTTYDFDSDYGKADLEFENLIFLLDETEYVVKSNYKGSGNSETYCNYKLSGGKGTILSQGTALEITWGVSNGKLWMKDAQGNAVKLNPGKSYIGYGSSNKGGGVTLNFEN